MEQKSRLKVVKTKLLKCFDTSQNPLNVESCHKEFIRIFDSLYDTDLRASFRESLLSLVRGIVLSDNKSPFTRRLLSFSARCIARIHVYISGTDPDDEDSQTEADTEIGLYIDSFLKMTLYESLDARLNSIYLFSKLVSFFKNIDLSFFMDILKRFTMLSIHDKDSSVRCQALQGISIMAFRTKFDPEIFQGPFQGAVRVLEDDKECSVRISALKSLPFNSHTIQLFVIASMDDSAIVRKNVIDGLICHLTQPSDIKPDILHILLKNLFYSSDSEGLTHKRLFDDLFAVLIKICEHDVVILAHYLNVHQDKPFFEQLFYSYFDHLRKGQITLSKSNAFFELIHKFSKEYLDMDSKLLKDDQEMFSSLACMWFLMATYCRNFELKRVIEPSNKEDGDDSNDSISPFIEILDIVDDILPMLNLYGPFVVGVLNDIVQSKSTVKQELTLHYLLRLFGLYSFNLKYLHDITFETLQQITASRRIRGLYGNCLEETFGVIAEMEQSSADYFKAFISISEFIFSKLKPAKNSTLSPEEQESVIRLELFEAFLQCYKFETYVLDSETIQEVHGFVDEFVVPGLNSNNEEIVLLSISCLCGFCLLSSKFVDSYSHHFLKFLKQKQISKPQIYSLEALCDFVYKFSFDSVHFSPENVSSSRRKGPNDSESILVSFLRKFFHSPQNRFDGIDEKEYSLDYRLFSSTTKAICKLAIQKHYWSIEFFSKLIIMFLSDDKIGDPLREFIQGFFSEFCNVFQSSDADEDDFRKGISSPFVECFSDVIRKLFTIQKNESLDKSLERSETFFLSLCEDHYDVLSMKASDMIMDPMIVGGLYEKMQLFNIDLLLTMDFATLKQETLSQLQETSLSQEVDIVQIRGYSKRPKRKTDPVQEGLKRLHRKIQSTIAYRERGSVLDDGDTDIGTNDNDTHEHGLDTSLDRSISLSELNHSSFDGGSVASSGSKTKKRRTLDTNSRRSSVASSCSGISLISEP